MKYNSFKLKILLPYLLTIFLLLILSVLAVQWTQTNSLDIYTKSQLIGVEDGFKSSLDNDADLLSGMLYFLQDNENLQSAFLAQNRTLLYSIARPIFDDLHASYNTTHFYFTLANRTNLLRVHNFNSFGDLINRYTTTQALTTMKLTYGIELGASGVFSLRVVLPWIVNDNLIGFLELGEEISHISLNLKEILSVELLFIIEKSNIDKSLWEKGNQFSGISGNWDQYENYAIIDKTLSVPPSDLGSLEGQSAKDLRSFIIDSKSYKAGLINLYDVKNEQLGYIVVFSDVSSIESNGTTIVLYLLMLFLIVSSILFVFFVYNTNNIEKKIEKEQKSTEQVANKLKITLDSIVNVALSLTNSSQEFASSIEEVNASSEEISAISQQMAKGSTTQTAKVNESLKFANDLSENFSTRIDEVQKTSALIENITGQVNMLALNASIEAARAGEYGRGFSVVADNIRNLADDTKKSLNQVTGIISSLKDSLSASIEKINNSIQSVVAISEQNSASAEEASAATEEQSATMSQMAESANSLASLANSLQSIVEQYSTH